MKRIDYLNNVVPEIKEEPEIKELRKVKPSNTIEFTPNFHPEVHPDTAATADLFERQGTDILTADALRNAFENVTRYGNIERNTVTFTNGTSSVEVDRQNANHPEVLRMVEQELSRYSQAPIATTIRNSDPSPTRNLPRRTPDPNTDWID